MEIGLTYSVSLSLSGNVLLPFKSLITNILLDLLSPNPNYFLLFGVSLFFNNHTSINPSNSLTNGLLCLLILSLLKLSGLPVNSLLKFAQFIKSFC